MEPTKIHVLAIAPYKPMKTTLEHVVESFPNLQVDIRIGDLEAGVDIIREYPTNTAVDVIVSRGGTAALIREITTIPVIEIPISVYDVLRTIRLAQSYNGQCCVVGFPEITKTAHTLVDLLGKHIDIITVRCEADVRETLLALHQQASCAVVCDTITHRTAREMNFPAYLIDSGDESLHEAFRQAESMGSVFRQMRRENILQHLLLDGNTAIFDTNRTLLRAYPKPPSAELQTCMRSHIRKLHPGEELHFLHRLGTELHELSMRQESFEGETIYLFHDQIGKIPLNTGRMGISALERDECEHLFTTSFYSVSGAMGNLINQLPDIAQSHQSILILGEIGTGKEQIAKALYLASDLTNKPLTVINCQLTDAKTWDFLFTSQASPFSSKNCAVFIQHLDVLTDSLFDRLLAAMQETNLAKRIFLIFSCTVDESQPVPSTVRSFISQIGCRLLTMPPLRNRSDEIPSLASLYLAGIASQLHQPLAGFDPGAMDQLQRYDWPSNYTQFKRVLHELAVDAKSAYITSNACHEVLRKERRLNRRFTGSQNGIPYQGRTLQAIEGDIVLRVLKDNNNNQTAAAHQLGISRTTIWRILQASDQEQD